MKNLVSTIEHQAIGFHLPRSDVRSQNPYMCRTILMSFESEFFVFLRVDRKLASTFVQIKEQLPWPYQLSSAESKV